MNNHGSMNRAYNLVWNKALGVWAVVAETARGRSKGGSKIICRVSVAVAGCLAAVPSWAAPPAPNELPNGGAVTRGEATIERNGSNMNIDQSTDKAVLNWDSFSVGSDAAVTFQQPDADAVALNRVLGGDVSAIHGQLNANGQVFLVNPNGVVFGADSRVNVGGLVASTMDISDEDFMAGDYRFMAVDGSGRILNQGEITAADGGYVALLATQVENEGIIRAQMGTVAMAAGDAVTLQVDGSQFVGIQVDPAMVDTLIANRRLIQAKDGQVIMTASASQRLLEQAVPSDEQSAGQLVEEDGVFRLTEVGGTVNADTIRIEGGANSEVRVTGELDASSDDSNGGHIEVMGKHVGLMDGAQADASGQTGGGEVLIGGDLQGKNPAVRNAERTYIDEKASIQADAVETGDGGRVIVWADETTRFNGQISARGGAQEGDGGFAEVSGKAHLSYNGTTDLRAPAGETGTLLLDPYDITIQTAGPDSAALAAAPFTAAEINSTLTVATLQDALEVADVNVSTGAGGPDPGDITVANSLGWFTANTLTLDAARHITLDPSVEINTFDGNLVMTAQGGDITQGIGSRLRVGGTTGLTAGGAITLNSTTNQLFGNVSATAGGAISLNNSRNLLLDNLSGDNVILATSGSNGSILLNGGATFNANTLNVNADGSGSVSIVDIDGDLTLASATFGGTLSLGDNGTGALTLDSAGGNVIHGTGTGAVLLRGTTISYHDPIVTRGGHVGLTATSGNILGTADIFTTAIVDTGASSGSILLNSTGSIDVANLITTGASNNDGVGSNAAEVSLTADTTIEVGQITTTGGDATPGGAPNRNGGNAGNIGLQTGVDGTITLNGDLRAIGGAPQGASTQGLGGFIFAGDPIILTDDRLIDTGATSGGITFESTVDSDLTNRALTLTAGTGSVLFENALGASQKLANLRVNSSSTTTVQGDINTSDASGIYISGNTINLGGSAPVILDSREGDGTVTFSGYAMLQNDVTITRGTGAVTFQYYLNSASVNNDLVIDGGTGTGNVNFNNWVGNSGRLGNIRLDGVANLTVSGLINAGSLIYANSLGEQVGGTGTAYFGNTQNYDQAGGLQVFTSGGITQSYASITTSGGPVSLQSTGGALNLNNNNANINTNNGNVTLRGTGVTHNYYSNINAGSGQIIVDGNNAAIALNGTVTTTYDSPINEDAAIILRNASSVSLGGVSAINGILRVGEMINDNANIAGNVSQNTISSRRLDVNTFEAAVGGQINLNSTYNIIDNLGDVSLGGALTVSASGRVAGMNLTGDLAATSINIRTGNGALVLGDRNITATAGNIHLQGRGLTQDAGSVVDAGAGTIFIQGSDVTNIASRGAINMAGSLTTMNTSSNAVRFYNGNATTIGNITTGAGGWVRLGLGSTDFNYLYGAINQTADTTINTGTVSAYASGAVILGNDNQITTVSTIERGGALVINDIADGLNLAAHMTTGTITNDVAITTAGGALLLGGYEVGGDSIVLGGVGITGSGQIEGSLANDESVTLLGNSGAIAVGRIITNELTGSTTSTATLTNNENDIRNLNDFSTSGNFLLHNHTNSTTPINIIGDVTTGPGTLTILTPEQGINLTADGSLTGSGITLTAERSGSAISLAGNVNADADNIVLSSQGGISQSAGTINTTGVLSGSAVNAVTLGQANTISQLGPFPVTGTGQFLLNDLNGLQLAGSITTNSGSVAIATTGSELILGAHNVTSSGASSNMALTGRGVTQAADSTLDGDGGTILVNGHDGTAAGAVSLAGLLSTTSDAADAITVRGATTAALGTITAASGTVSIGDNDISGAVTQIGDTLINAETLQINTQSAVTLDNANTFGRLGLVQTGGDLLLNDSTDGLIMTDAVTSAGGTTIQTAGGALAIGDNSIVANGAVNLQGVGITQAAASIVNATSGDITLRGGDAAVNLAGGLITNSITDNAIRLLDGTTLALGNVTATGGRVTLGGVDADNFSGVITQTGVILADSLTGNTGASLTLNNSNQIGTLAGFTSGGAFTLRDTTGGLVVTDTVSTGGTTLLETAGGALTLGDSVLSAAGQQLTLTGVGVNQAGAGQILADDSTVLGGTGSIDLSSALNDFTGTVLLNSTGPSTSVRDANNLTLGTLGNLGPDTSITAVAGTVLTLTAEDILTQAGSVALYSLDGNLRTDGDIETVSGDITLSASQMLNLFDPIASTNGDIALSGSSINHASGGLSVATGGAGTLSVDATGGNFTMASDFEYRTDIGQITITATGNAGLADIVTNGTLAVTAHGPVSQVAGHLQAGVLDVETHANDGAGITLLNPDNAIANIRLQTLNADANAAAAGNIQFRAGSGFDVAGITTTDAVSLTGGAAITQSGAIAANALSARTLHNVGAAITLDHADNNVASINLQARNLTDTTTTNGVLSYRDHFGFDVARLLTLGNGKLQAGGDVSQSGAITSNGLGLSGQGNFLLSSPENNVAVLAAAIQGNLNFASNRALVVGEVNPTGITTGGGSLTINATSFDSSGFAIDTSGLDGGNGGNISVVTGGPITVGTVTANGSAALVASAQNGGNSGDIELASSNGGLAIVGPLSARGAAGDSAGVPGDDGRVVLFAENGSITQSAAIDTGGLIAMARDSVSLTNAGNTVDTLAAQVSGAGQTFNFNNDGDLTLGQVHGFGGLSSNNGDINLVLTGGDLHVSQAVNTGGGDFTSAGVDFTTSGDGTLTSGGGAIDLNGHTGNVTLGAGLTTAGGALLATSATNFDSSTITLNTTGSHNIAGGTVSLATTGALTVADIVTQGGVDANDSAGARGGNVTLNSGGALTLGAITSAGSNAQSPLSNAGGQGGTVALTGPAGITLNDDINAAAGEGAGAVPGGAVTFNHPVTLNGDRTINSGAITFSDTLALDTGLTVFTGNGNLGFGGAVSGTGYLTAQLDSGLVTGLHQLQNTIGDLEVSSTSELTLNNIDITGSQTYNADVVLSGLFRGNGLFFNSAVTLAGNTEIDARTFALHLEEGAAGGAHNLSLTADKIDWTAALNTTGTLLVQPTTINRNITLGGEADAGALLDITTAQLAFLPNDPSHVIFGRSDGTGNLQVASPLDVNSELTLRGGNLGQSAPLHSGNLNLLSNGGTIDLSHTENHFGNVAIAGSPTAVSLVNNSPIIQAGAWLLPGIAVALDAQSFDISLTEAANQLGNLALTGNNADVVVTGPLVLNGTALTGNLSAQAPSGSILVSDTYNTSGNSSLAADSAITIVQAFSVGGDLLLTAGDLISQGVSGDIDVTGTTTLDTTAFNAGDVFLRNTSPTTLGTSLIGGDFTLTSDGIIVQADGSTLRVAGEFITPGTGSVNLNGSAANVFGAYSGAAGNVITTLGTITLEMFEGQLQARDSANNIFATAINTNGDLVVVSRSGGLGFNDVAIADTAINLNNAGNALGGNVVITTAAPAVVDSGASVETGISQTTPLNVSGQALFTAEPGNVGNSGVIDLADMGNSFGSLQLSGTDVSVSQTGNMVVDAASADLLTLSTTDTVNQTGAIRTDELRIDAGGTVALQNSNNTIDRLGASTIVNGGLLLNNAAPGLLIDGAVTTDGGSVNLGTRGTLTISPTGAITTQGAGDNIVLSTAGNFVNQAGPNALSTHADAAWQIWSTSPLLNTLDGLTSDFKQYNAVYGETAVLGTGNGTLFTLAPVVTAALTGSISQVYDGSVDARLSAENYQVSGTVDDDTVVLNNPATGTFDDKNVGEDKAINVDGLAIASATNGDTVVYGYQLANDTASTVGDVTPASITAVTGITAADKIYDGSDAATLTTTAAAFSGLVGEDQLNVTNANGVFADGPNAGNDLTVAISGLTLGGADVGNYMLTDTTANTEANILPRVVNLHGSRTYDGTVTAAAGVLTMDTLVGTETLTLAGAGSVNDRHAGNGKAVTIGELTLGDGDNGGLAGNYTLSGGTHTLDITQAALNITTNDVTRTYDGSLNANGEAVATDGTQLFTDDAITSADYAFTNANAGTGKTVTVGNATVDDGNNGGNYAITYTANTSSTIEAAPLTLSTSDVSKTYDGGLSANGTAIVTSGTLYANTSNAGAQDTISGGNFAFTDPNVGLADKRVTVSGVNVSDGNNGANYAITYADNTTSSISPYAVDLQGSRAYNGTVIAAADTLNFGTLVGDETLTLTGAGSVDNRHVGTDKAVTLGELTLGDGDNGGLASNYTFVGGTHTLDITPAALSITTTDITRTYDGSLNANGQAIATNGTQLFADDAITSADYAFTNANAGTDKTVTVGNATVNDGNNGGNYTVTYTANTSSTIEAAPLTLSTSDLSKTYDGGLSANGIAIVTDGTLYTNVSNAGAQDTISGGSFAFTDPNVGLGNKRVTVTDVSISDGNSGANYAVTYADNTTSTISPYAVDLHGSRTYNGTVIAAADTLDFGTLVGDETLTLTGAGSVNNRHVGNNQAVTLGTLTLGDGENGGLASNYTFSSGTHTLDITPAALNITSTDVTRTYDGSLSANGQAVATNGTQLFAADAITSAVYAFTNANAGTDKTVDVSNAAINDGNNGGNYTVTYTANTSSTIEAAPLTLSTSNVNKTYDGGLSANGTAIVTDGTLYTNVSNAGAQDTIGAGSFAFTDPNVGLGNKRVTVTSVVVSDGNSGANYRVTYADNTGSTIDPAMLTAAITGTPQRIYDGTIQVTLAQDNFALSGFVAGESAVATQTEGSFNSADVAQATTVTADLTSEHFTPAESTLLTNYSLPVNATGPGAITPRTVNLTGQRVYDSTNIVAGSIFEISNRVGDETLLLAGTGTVPSKNVTESPQAVAAGNLTLANGTNGGLASNYQLAGGTHTAIFTPATLTVAGLVALDKIYDGTDDANLSLAAAVPSGVFAGDDVSVQFASGVMESRNVGDNIGVSTSEISLSGDDQDNYVAAPVAGLSASITPRSLTVTATGHGKVYDGLLDAQVTLQDNRIAGDAVSLSYSANFLDKNVGNGKFINVSDLAIAGGDGGNYTLEAAPSAFGSIMPADLQITTSNVLRRYDGTRDASGNPLVMGDTQLFGTDSISGGNYIFDNANAGTNKTVVVSGVTINDGNNGNNYTVAYENNTDSTITPAPLTITTSNVNKVYDGNAIAEGNAVISAGTLYRNVSNGNNPDRISGGTFTFTDKNVGFDNKRVAVENITIMDGNSGNNYNITYTDNLSSTISPAPVTADIIGTPNRPYNGNTSVLLTNTNFALFGFVENEGATVAPVIGTFNSPEVSDAHTVTATLEEQHFIAATETRLSNYSLPDSASGPGFITPYSAGPDAPDAGELNRPLPVIREQDDTGAGGQTGPESVTTTIPTDGRPGAGSPGGLPSIRPSEGSRSTPGRQPGILAESGGPVGMPTVPTAGPGIGSRSTVAPVVTGSSTTTASPAAAPAGMAGGVTGGFVSVKTLAATEARPGSSFALQLPQDTFVHDDDNIVLAITATLANGELLPAWLQFDASTLRFSGMVPDGQQNLEILVVARDPVGSEAFTRLELNFENGNR